MKRLTGGARAVQEIPRTSKELEDGQVELRDRTFKFSSYPVGDGDYKSLYMHISPT